MDISPNLLTKSPSSKLNYRVQNSRVAAINSKPAPCGNSSSDKSSSNKYPSSYCGVKHNLVEKYFSTENRRYGKGLVSLRHEAPSADKSFAPPNSTYIVSSLLPYLLIYSALAPLSLIALYFPL